MAVYIWPDDDDREWFDPIHRKLGGSSVHLMMRIYPCAGTNANPRRWIRNLLDQTSEWPKT